MTPGSVLCCLLAAGLLLGLPACSDASCDGLPQKQAERERQRGAYRELSEGPAAAPAETVTAAHDALLVFERQVHELEQRCSRA